MAEDLAALEKVRESHTPTQENHPAGQTGEGVTERDVIAWIRARASALMAEVGSPSAAIGVYVRVERDNSMFTAWSYAHAADDCGASGFTDGGECVNSAVADLVAILGNPNKRAEEKRQMARQLIAEADAIAATQPPENTP